MEGPPTESVPVSSCPSKGVGSEPAATTLADPLVQANPGEYYRAMRVEDPAPIDTVTAFLARFSEGKAGLYDSLRRWFTAETVWDNVGLAVTVEAVAWLLSDAASYVTGATIMVDGGYTAW